MASVPLGFCEHSGLWRAGGLAGVLAEGRGVALVVAVADHVAEVVGERLVQRARLAGVVEPGGRVGDAVGDLVAGDVEGDQLHVAAGSHAGVAVDHLLEARAEEGVAELAVAEVDRRHHRGALAVPGVATDARVVVVDDPADLLGADGVGVADLGGVLDVLAAGERRVAARPVGGERVDPALAGGGVVARGRGVDEGDTLAVAQPLGGDLAEVRRLAGHVDGLALRGLQARQHHLGEAARDLRGALREQLAEHGGGRQLGGRRADVEQLAADGVEVVVAVAELHAGVALAGGEDVDLVRQHAGVARQHDQARPPLDLALGEPDRLAAGHPGSQPRVGEDVEVREDPAADPVEPGLLLVTADGHHEPAVEHRHARDLLRGAEDGAAGGVGLAGVGHRDLLGRHPEQVLGVLVEEGRRRARGVRWASRRPAPRRTGRRTARRGSR